MKLKVKKFNISSGGPLIALLNYEDANKLDLTALDRIRVKKQGISQVVAIDISKDKRTIKPGFIGLFEEVSDILKVKNNETVDIEVEPKPISVDFIRKKLDGDHLSKMEINEIVRDIVQNRLTETETTFFVSACYRNGTTIYESAYLTESIVENGKKLELDKYPILDKHCISGDIPVMVKNSGKTKVKPIREIIDSIFEKCKSNEIYKDGDAEYTTKNLNNLKVLTFDDKGGVSYKPVSAVRFVAYSTFIIKSKYL